MVAGAGQRSGGVVAADDATTNHPGPERDATQRRVQDFPTDRIEDIVDPSMPPAIRQVLSDECIRPLTSRIVMMARLEDPKQASNVYICRRT